MQRISIKRVGVEIIDMTKRLWDTDANCQIETIYNLGKAKIKIGSIIFVCREYYPFRPPDVTINGELYKRWMIPPTPRINTMHERYNIIEKMDCYCCLSKANPQVWSPMCKMNDILDEIDNIKRYKRKIRHILIIEEIFKHRSNINEQIIEHIYQYIL